MILELADQVCAQVDRVIQLDAMNDQAQNTKATVGALAKTLTPAMRKLTSAYSLLLEQFPHADLQQVRQQISSLALEVRDIHKAFETQPKQEIAITKAAQRVDSVTSQLQSVWVEVAGKQARPAVELYGLLHRFPEILDQAEVLNRLKTRILERATRLPTTREELTDFDNDIRALRERLSHVEGLNPAVMRFLRKLLAGHATVADLTDEEVLAWCRRDEHARVLHISL